MPNIPATVTPLPTLPPRHSLLTSAPIIEPTDDRWQGGITWRPEPCAAGAAFDPCSAASLYSSSDDQGSVVSYRPFGVAFSVSCSTFSEASSPEAIERARRKLLAGESYVIERELERGAIGVTFTPDNQFLADGTANDFNSGTTTSPVRALADLEDFIGDQVHGRGYIHATRRTVTYWLSHGLVRELNGVLTTALGTVVIAGAGYVGPAYNNVATIDATGATAWAFATGQVEITRSPIIIYEPQPDDINVDNTINVLATRLYAVNFDECGHGAVKIEHCTSLDTCTPGA